MNHEGFGYGYKFENGFGNPAMESERNEITIAEIGGFRIDPDVKFILTVNDEGTFVNCDVLNLHSSGTDMEDAKKDLLSDIEFIWDHYIDGDQNGFGEEAKAFVKRFSKHVTRM